MIRKLSAVFLLSFVVISIAAQQGSYTDSIQQYQAKYIREHGVIRGKDQSLLRFFPVSQNYRVAAHFQRIYSAGWFDMETSGAIKKAYRVYGILSFTLNDTLLQLRVYQSQQLMNTKEYADNLFAPFTDKTNGEESYENGRYIEMNIQDLAGGTYLLDFNKAYNPFCAYISNVYNCPIPPKENNLPVAVKAGEMKFRKGH